MPQVQYPGLADSFGKGSFVGANQDLEQMFAAQRNEQLNQQKALADQQYEAQQRPLSLASDAIKLQQANRDEQLQQLLYEGKKNNALAEQKAKAASYDAPQIEKFGNSLLQLGTMAKQNGGQLPMWMKPQIPDALWQDIHSEGGADRFIAHGKAIVDNKDKFISQESKQGNAAEIAATKAESAAEVARINAAARVKAAELANARAKAALAAKPQKQDKQSYENYAVKLEAEADNLAMQGDAESVNKAHYLKGLAQQYKDAAIKLKTAPTDVKTDAQTSLETELGVRKPKPAGQAASAAPATTKPLEDPLGIRK